MPPPGGAGLTGLTVQLLALGTRLPAGWRHALPGPYKTRGNGSGAGPQYIAADAAPRRLRVDPDHIASLTSRPQLLRNLLTTVARRAVPLTVEILLSIIASLSVGEVPSSARSPELSNSHLPRIAKLTILFRRWVIGVLDVTLAKAGMPNFNLPADR